MSKLVEKDAIHIVEEADVITQIPLDANDPRATRVHHSER